MGSEKLEAYKQFKSELKMENYLSLGSTEVRQKLAKFRIRAHRLQIELGHYKNPYPVPRELRFCTKCNCGSIENEFHALMRCAKFSKERLDLFSALNKMSVFRHLKTDADKFVFIMKNISFDYLII